MVRLWKRLKRVLEGNPSDRQTDTLLSATMERLLGSAGAPQTPPTFARRSAVQTDIGSTVRRFHGAETSQAVPENSAQKAIGHRTVAG
jgi:hypothetical protein